MQFEGFSSFPPQIFAHYLMIFQGGVRQRCTANLWKIIRHDIKLVKKWRITLPACRIGASKTRKIIIISKNNHFLHLISYSELWHLINMDWDHLLPLWESPLNLIWMCLDQSVASRPKPPPRSASWYLGHRLNNLEDYLLNTNSITDR